MRELARKSSVTPKTLYDQFGSKDRLLLTAMKERFRHTYEAIQAETIKNGFDNGLVSIFDVMTILKRNKIDLPLLMNSAESLGLKKNICYFLSIINYRFDDIKIDQEYLIKKESPNLSNYEDLILMNYADAFSFRLFNKRRKYNAFSYEAFLSESGRSKITLQDFFRRVFRIISSFSKTIFSISTNKRFRVDVKRVQEINKILEGK